MNQNYNPSSCIDCKYNVWYAKNYCWRNKRLITEKYNTKIHPKCSLKNKYLEKLKTISISSKATPTRSKI